MERRNKEVDEVEEKFRHLVLSPFGSLELSSLNLIEPKGKGGGSGTGGGLEGGLKAVLKELSTHCINEDGMDKIRAHLQQAVSTYREGLSSSSKGEGTTLVQDKIRDSLLVLKTLGETPVPKSFSSEDGFYESVIVPNLSQVYLYLGSVIEYCAKEIRSLSSSQGSTSASGGLGRHQLLGLLQKGVKVCLTLLKRGLSMTSAKDKETITITSLRDLGTLLCNLLKSEFEVDVDTRCNIGIALVYLILYECNGRTRDAVSFLEQVFTSDSQSNQENKDKGHGGQEDEDTTIWEQVGTVCNKDINRLGLAIGVLSTLDLKTVDMSNLVYAIANNTLNIDFGTKESLNLGSARVFESILNKLSDPSCPLQIIERTFPLFSAIEVFIFTYIPGHIDSVKSCCKEMLISLTKIYQRLTLNPSEDRFLQELITKILTKTPHVKWTALSCVARTSPLSISVLKIDPTIPLSLLTTPRSSLNSASDCYTALMAYDFPSTDPQTWEERWLLPLFQIQSKEESNWTQKRQIINSIMNSDKRLTQLEILRKPVIEFVIKKMKSSEISSSMLFAETIKIASETGFEIQIPTNNDNETYFRGLVPKKVLNAWLWHQNPQIRLAGFSLLGESRKTSQVITPEDFESLKILLKYNLVSQNTAFRQQFMSYFRKLLQRIKDSQSLLQRKKNTLGLEHYTNFFHWLWHFLSEDEGLFYGSSFARRIQTLECLTELIKNFDDFDIYGLHSDKSIKYLSWLTDTYENNKIHALGILSKMPIPGFQDEKMCDSILNEALTLCESIKPPHSVTGRYLLVLLMKKSSNIKYSAINLLNLIYTKLEQTYESILTTSLTQVSSEKPMYGLIRSIKMIINETNDYLKDPKLYKSFFNKLFPLLYKYEDLLVPLLCNPAPEGFLPNLNLPDSKDDNNQVVRSITAQMLLVCSWRSMRDVCLLLGDCCLLLPLEGESMDTKDERILSFDQVSEIGNHMLDLMKNLVHRGVFEQVFVAFKTLAYRLWRSSNPKLNALPSKWLNDAMDEEHMSSKCITRRSAGLPFIFQALLSPEKDNTPFLSEWIQRVFIKDENPKNSYVRIHAMNVLRGLYRDTNFAKAMMPFVPDGLRIAFRGLKSNVWTERNAGLMLYGAVIRRVFGPKLHWMCAPTYFRRFPQMYDFLLEELNICLSSIKDPSINLNPSDFTFHLLLLLSSFSPPQQVEDEHFKLSKFTTKLRYCGASKDIEVRKLSARAIIPFLSPNDVSLLINILTDMKNWKEMSTNSIHGSFLQVEAIIDFITTNGSKTQAGLEDVINSLHQVLSSQFISTINCPTIFASIAQVLFAFNNFPHPVLKQIFYNLREAYHKRFNNKTFRHRNIVPGLPIADINIAKGTVCFTLSSLDLEEDRNKDKISETIYNWFIFNQEDPTLLEQLIDYLIQNKETLHLILDNEDCVILEAIISTYLSIPFKYVGQSILELKFLDLLSQIDGNSFKPWIHETETPRKLGNRLFSICNENCSTNEHKRGAIILLSKLTFESGLQLSESQEETLISSIFIQWADSSMDDDLRFGVAIGLPKIPFEEVKVSHQPLNGLHQSKIWLTVFNLCQDENPEIRSILHSKIEKNSACDRKALENLVSSFFQTFVSNHPHEGITLILGLLLKEDFEIHTDEAPDDEDGRLFDKNELNMFNEPVILAKIVQEYLMSNQLMKSYQKYLEVPLTPELTELYELASSCKLYVCKPSLNVILDLVRMRLRYDNDSGDDDDKVSKVCPNDVPIGYLAQSRILNILEQVL